MDHREDSTFSFDPSNINVKKLSKHKLKKIDARKGVLLASYTRKKTRRRKRTKGGGPTSGGGGNTGGGNSTASSPLRQEEKKSTSNTKARRSVTPSPSPSPRHSHSSPKNQALPPKTTQPEAKCPDTLHPSNRLGTICKFTSSS